jgi:CheY-like chemotaxis protein
MEIYMFSINDVTPYLNDARILLIDDSEPFRRLTSLMLENSGVATVTLASSLSEGMHKMHYFHDAQSAAPAFDIVIMDIHLPDGDGLEGCKFISSHAATFNIPVIVISGASRASVINQAFEAGASDYLQKPLVASLLKMRLTTLLKLKGLECEELKIKHNKKVVKSDNPLI